MTAITTPAGLHPTIAAFEASLAEHARLTALSATLAMERASALVEVTKAVAAADAAKAEVRLSPPAARAAAEKEASRVQKVADQARAVVEDVEAAQRALPAKLREADAVILAADSEAAPAIGAVCNAERDACMAELSAGVAAILPTLTRLYGLAAVGMGGIRGQLEECKLVFAAGAGGVRLSDGRLTIDGQMTDLRTAWLDDPASLATRSRVEPLMRLQAVAQKHRSRIAEAEERERIAEYERSRGEYRPQHTGPLRDPAAEAAANQPKRTFYPNNGSFTVSGPAPSIG